jgi:hypothetical protein
MEPAPSCSVNINPDSISYHNCDPYGDATLALRVLYRELEQIERLSSKLPQTDRNLELLDKKRKLVQHEIERIAVNSVPVQPVAGVRTYPRKEKRIAKKFRRKADRFEQGRK